MTDRPTSHVPVPEGDGTPHPTVDEPRRFRDQRTVAMRSGDPMPSLGFGTYELGEDDTRRLVGDALRLGVRHVDTAQSYGNEAAVGDALRSSGVPREEVFLTTKVDDDHHEPAQLVDSVSASLERLGTDHVDLLLIHWPSHFDRIAATLDALAQVQASGRARHIGLSNFTEAQLNEVEAMAPLEVLQAECHPFFQQPGLRQWCVDRGWAFTAYAPIARGEVLDDDVLRDIADAHGVTPPAIALAWLLAQPQVVAIPRTSDAEHLEANLAALDVALTDAEIGRITGLDAGRRLVDPPTAPW